MDLFETERIGDCMNISKFTQKSQEVVQGCEKIAMDHGHQEIGQEHMLSAMMTVYISKLNVYFVHYKNTPFHLKKIHFATFTLLYHQ